MIMKLLSRAAITPIADYNPAYVIEAVNALQPLGKKRALGLIDEYLAGADSSANTDGLFWVLRVLFDLPQEECYPPVGLGAPSPPAPADEGNLSRYPIVMIRDVPFLVVGGYFLAGFPERVQAHVACFRTHGILRRRPLMPAASAVGLEASALRVLTAAYTSAGTREVLRLVHEQIARMNAGR